MTKLVLQSAWVRKRRLLGAAFAVFVGVAFLSGTLALGQTLQRNFDELFADANAGTDAVVRSATEIDTETNFERGPIDASVVERARAVDGVASVAPYVEGYGQLLDKEGEAIGGNGPPRLAATWIDDPDLNAYRLAEGRAPRAADEVVINRGAADDGDLAVGDTTVVETPRPMRVRIVGIATFASAGGFGDTTYTAFTLPAAQRAVLDRTDQVTSVRVKAEDPVDQDELVARLERELPSGVEAISGDDQSEENTQAIGEEFLDGMRMFLVVFAGIALLVGAFSIYNTLSILAAQRTRESALMRAVGASRRQLLGAQLTESLLIGLAASLLGLLGGVGIATGLKGLFDAVGGSLPDGGLVFGADTAILSVVVGLLVTALAGIVPARRAARVAPVAALRDVASESGTVSRARVITGGAVTAAGAAAVVAAALGGGPVALAVLGALATLVGFIALGPALARPASAVLGAPLARLGGTPGALARDNAMRNPRRTAGTAAALMVGVGVVSMFTVFAGSLKASIQDDVGRSFTGDLAISPTTWGGGGIDPGLVERVGRLPQIDGAVGIGQGAARLGGESQLLAVADPERLRGVVDLNVEDGSLDRLGTRDLAVSENLAEEQGWSVGSRVPVRFADTDGGRFEVAAIYANDQIVGDALLSRAAWAPHAVQDLDTVAFLTVAPGTDVAAAQTAVERLTRPAGNPDVETRQEYVDASAGGVNALLGIVYVMLFLAVVIALMGIANTLTLSIRERTRELGVLRAVGATRRQLRAMVRGEALVIAVFGTIGGVLLGLFLGWGLVRGASTGIGSFDAPPVQLAVVLVAGAIVGVLASLRPARRAARLDVLRAVAAE